MLVSISSASEHIFLCYELKLLFVLSRCDRSYCPEAAMPVCDVGESRVPVRTSECCVTYECECDETKCPSAKEDCPEGYKLVVSQVNLDLCENWLRPAIFFQKKTVENACCAEVFECQCDETSCPAEADITCDSEAGYKLITTTSPRFAFTLPTCCPMQYEQVCVCDRLVT